MRAKDLKFQDLLLSMIPRNGEKLKSFSEPSGQTLGDVDWNDPYLDWSIPVDDNNLRNFRL